MMYIKKGRIQLYWIHCLSNYIRFKAKLCKVIIVGLRYQNTVTVVEYNRAKYDRDYENIDPDAVGFVVGNQSDHFGFVPRCFNR